MNPVSSTVDHVTSYIFGNVSKRRSLQPNTLSTLSASNSNVGDDVSSDRSRRSSSLVSKRLSTHSSTHGSTLGSNLSAHGSTHGSTLSAHGSTHGSTLSTHGSGHGSTHGSTHGSANLTVEGAEDDNLVNGHSSREDSGDERNASNSVTVTITAATRFTCPLCKRQLSEPRVLPCLHAFCTACLRELDNESGSEMNLWNGEADVSYPGARGPKPVEEQNGGGGGSSAGSGYESEEPPRELGWSPLSARRTWRRGGNSNSGASAGSNAARLIVCPTCGTEARIPVGGVLMFPLHYVLQHRMLLASLARDAAGAAGSVLCDLCSTDVQVSECHRGSLPSLQPHACVQASSRCSDCLLSLCTFCSEAHQRQRRTAAHEVLPLQEARRRGMRTLRQPLCPAHPGQELRFFCEACGQVACRDCCVTLHRDHRPPCEAAARVSPAYLSAVRDVLERARPVAEGVRSVLERLQLLEQRIQNKASAVQQEVDNHIDAWVAALEAHRHALSLQVRKARESKVHAIRAQQLELERRSGDVSHAVRFADELLAEGSEVEVLSTVTPLLRRLEWCCATGAGVRTVNSGGSASSSSSSTAGASLPEQGHGAPTIARVSDCLEFLPGEVAGRTAEGLPLFGVVTTQTCSASHCRLDMDALNTCRQHKRAEVLLITRDSENQSIGHGGAEIAVELRARDAVRRPLVTHVNDQGDGTYLITFLPDSAGNYTLTVHVQNKPIHGSPFLVYVRPLRPHSGVFHCCTFCSSNGSKDVPCGCGAKMIGGYRGCGHGHTGHPGRRHWSCCGSVLESSECGRGTASSASVYQFPL